MFVLGSCRRSKHENTDRVCAGWLFLTYCRLDIIQIQILVLLNYIKREKKAQCVERKNFAGKALF